MRKYNSLGSEDMYSEFNSTKYGTRSLPTWGDRDRYFYKSWKHCTKRRHQWKEKAA